MSKEIYLQKLASINAIDPNLVVSPNMPVAIALQEGEDLAVWCTEDKEALVKSGLDWTLVEDLPLRIAATRYVQSEWNKMFQSREEAQKEWAGAYPSAYELRDELLHHCFHAFRKDSDLCNKATRISEGSGHADMLQDLSDLSVLGKANAPLLAAIGVDLSLLDKAAALSSELANLLARSNGERMSDNALRIDRDRAYSYMKQAVDEIRHHGQYLFWKNEARKKGYVSRYIHKSKQATKVVAPAAPAAPAK